jgi:hypothetical protein
VRAPAEAWAEPVPEERLRELADVLEGLAPVEVIGHYRHREHAAAEAEADAQGRIVATLARRPCGAAELATSLGLHPALVAKLLEELCHAGTVERVPLGPTTQYRCRARSERS